MNKFSLGGKRRASTAAPAKQQWRAYDDGPINLSARPAVDSATGQKAFVLAFAAMAVAGAAYFATVMIAPEDDPTLVVASANASPQEIRSSSQPAPAPAPAPVEVAAPAAQPTEVATAQPVPAQPVATAEAAAAPQFPAPVRVKTVAIPSPKKAVTAAAPAAEPPAAADGPAAQVAAVAPQPEAPVVIGGVKQVENPAEMTAAYANTDGLVSEGIEAVLGVAAKEDDNPVRATRKKPVAQEETQVASNEPEMAGSAAGTRRIRSGVNMRAAPKSGSQIIGTIPTNAAVTVAPGCKHWCAVSYNGKRGFIYKSFLR